MSDDLDRLEKQQTEEQERTRKWESDRQRPLGQEPENPQRTREWDQDKKPEKK